jgi:adenylate cyclase
MSGVNGQTNLDSLYSIWQNEELDDSSRADALRSYYRSFEWGADDRLLPIMSLKKFSIERNLVEPLGDAYFDLGNYFEKKDEVLALKYFDSSGMVYSQHTDYALVIEVYNSLGSKFKKHNMLGKSLDYCIKAKELSEKTGYQEKSGKTYELYATLLSYRDKDLSYQAYQEAATRYKTYGQESSHGRMLTIMGDFHRQRDQFDSALYYYERHYEVMRRLNRIGGISSYFFKRSTIYAAQGDYKNALIYIDTAIQKNGTLQYINFFYRIKAQYLFKSGQLRASILLFSKSLQMAEELEHKYEIGICCNWLFQAHDKLGNHEKALKYFKRYIELKEEQSKVDLAEKWGQVNLKQALKLDSVNDLRRDEIANLEHDVKFQKEKSSRNIAVGAALFTLLIGIGLFLRNRSINKSKSVIEKEKNRSEQLLLNILPAEIAAELKENGKAKARDFEQVSILFTDFKKFTQVSEKLSAQELVEELNHCFEAFDLICEQYSIEKIKTLGDSYMAAGGLPVPKADSTQRLTLVALEMTDFVLNRQKEREAEGKLPFEMRVGIHTGPVVAGIVGVKKFQYDIWGDTVNTASRMESHGEVGKVNISQATYELIKEEPLFAFNHRGKIEAKGKGEVDMYFVNLRSS